jgi:5-formyltetrahydrofolate cyclo-ligase
VAPVAVKHYIARAGLWGASGDTFPGALRSQRELSLAWSVDRVTWRPPTSVGSRDLFSDGFRGSARFSAIVTTHDLSISERKPALRAEALARRDALPVETRAAGSETVASRFAINIPRGAIVSGFWPMRSEIDPRPLMRRLEAAGAQLALPAVQGRGKPLAMRAWAFGAQLGRGVWGIREPLPEAPSVLPDILLVPLAAFDRRGHRIGYGAGYYDMTIAGLRAKKPVLAVGLAFAVQEIAEVPAEDHDARLDLVLTERETIDFRGT